MQLRRRNLDRTNDLSFQDDFELKDRKIKEIDIKIWLLLVFIQLFFAYLTNVCIHNYPEPKTSTTSNDGDFVEEYARGHLLNITKIGIRTVGSYENENITVNYLLRTLKAMKTKANTKHSFEIISERSSGSFCLHTLGASFGFGYDNVNNIAVRLRPKRINDDVYHDLLVNCHYDSQIGTTGASDDVVSCALMLETLRVLSESSTTNEYGVVFLFNGAEETILQASHGFITTHPWAKSIRAFINLEAAGSGGRELLFQAGPGAPWLLDVYAKAAPHPFATVLAQELFQSGIIPSDTDFRIFRDYGKLSGLDIAYFMNGYVYHTKFDDVTRIPKGCIQKGGENLLAIVKAIANSPYLSKPSSFKKTSSLVFFDVYGFFMVSYPSVYGLIVNCLTCAVVIFEVLKKSLGIHSIKNYPALLTKAVFFQFMSFMLCLATGLCIALLLTFLDLTMSWYTNVWLIFPIYGCPSIFIMVLIHKLLKIYLKKNYEVNFVQFEKISFDATVLIFSIILFLLTIFKIDSAAIFLLIVLPPLLLKVRRNFKNELKFNYVMHIFSTIIPIAVIVYYSFTLIKFFVPLLGRTGNFFSPDYVICLFTSIIIFFLFSYNMSLVYVTKSVKYLLYLSFSIFTLGMVLVLFTDIGFPYSANPLYPTTQRLIVQHAAVTHHSENSVVKTQSGLWILPFDYYKINGIKHLSLMKRAKLITCNDSLPYCGLPYYFPLERLLKKTYWIDGPSPKILPLVNIVVSEKEISKHTVRIKFQLVGPERRTVMIRPNENIILKDWSMDEPGVEIIPVKTYNGTKHYFFLYVYGEDPKKPYEFWCVFESKREISKEKVVKIGVAGHHVQGEKVWSDLLKEFTNQLPDYVAPIVFTSDLHLFEF